MIAEKEGEGEGGSARALHSACCLSHRHFSLAGFSSHWALTVCVAKHFAVYVNIRTHGNCSFFDSFLKYRKLLPIVM